ncbi:MAG: protein kinase [Kofleriaceae bacterium]|nr:protein kinase [Kofleriaceae bacterium]
MANQRPVSPGPGPAMAASSPHASEEAFAQTVAPANPEFAQGSASRSSIESDATVQISRSGTSALTSLPALPEIQLTCYSAGTEVARGGMGRILTARDQRLNRHVAIKELLHPSPDQVLRFHREALITARLQHPSIVPIYEAGTWPDGTPFFAMKWVAGMPLDRIIADAASFEARLALLPRIAAAADAIAYAHSQRIVHRDLKPANVLIGEYGETVVIDWGLAKDLDADESALLPSAPSTPAPLDDSRSIALTVAGAVMGTPAYMAPEQARGESVGQPADVFALGAMLYHLLAGRPPYDARTGDEVIAAAALGNVVPLRSREQRIPPELIAIVERAMARDVANRYPSAREFSEELRRFLTGQLVDAHRYTAAQRVTRFMRRHRAALAISLVALIALSIGSVFAIRRIVAARNSAEAQRALAMARKQAAETLVDFMISDLKKRLVPMGRLDLVSGLGGQVKDYYQKIAIIPGGLSADDVDRMAQAMGLTASVEVQLGKFDDALTTWRQAKIRVQTSLGGNDTGPQSISRRRFLARADLEIAAIVYQRGETQKAEPALLAVVATLDQLDREAPNNRETMLLLADANDRLGDLTRNLTKIDVAAEYFLAAQRLREAVVAMATENGDRDATFALSKSHQKNGTIEYSRGASTKALAEFRACQRLRESLLETAPDNVEWLLGQVEIANQVGDMQREMGELKAAITSYRAAVPVIDDLLAIDATNTMWRRQRGNLLSDLGFALNDAGEYASAQKNFEAAIANHADLLRRDPASSNWQNDVSKFRMRLGDTLNYQGLAEQALASYQAAREVREGLVARDPKNVAWRRSLAWSYAKLAAAYMHHGEREQALEMFNKTIALRQPLAANAPTHSGLNNELASSQLALGRALQRTDKARAKDLVTQSLTRSRALVAKDPHNNEWKETCVSGLLVLAQIANTDKDATTERALLREAFSVAIAALESAKQNAFWPTYVAEIHLILADLDFAGTPPDITSATEHFAAARALLEPLEKSKTLPAFRKPLLQRAREGR